MSILVGVCRNELEVSASQPRCHNELPFPQGMPLTLDHLAQPLHPDRGWLIFSSKMAWVSEDNVITTAVGCAARNSSLQVSEGGRDGRT